MKRSNPFKIQDGEVRDSNVLEFSFKRDEGSYVDFDSYQKKERLGRFFDDKRTINTLRVFVFVLFLLFGRAFYLQIVQGSEFRDIAEGNRIRNEILQANRGLIYDRFGNLMVRNVSFFFLYIDPHQLTEDPLEQLKNKEQVAKILDIDLLTIDERLKEARPNEKVLIFENVPYESALKLMLLSEKEPGLEVTYEPRRQYLASSPMPHAMGYLGVVTQEDIDTGKYIGTDRIGKSGLELYYEDVLRGINGKRQVEVDALNREQNIIAQIEPKDGQDLVLTIDAAAQLKLTEIMADNSAKHGKDKMAVVVLDPKDGGVIAMHSLPTFDNNIFTTVLNREEYAKIIQDENNPLLNRVISGTYPLGSVFKLIVGAAALQERVINTSFTVNSVGGITVGSSFFPDWRGSGHGRTDIFWAIADSVNTFFYSIGGGNNQWLQTGLGVDRIVEYAKKFGLAKETNVDLESEVPGFLPSKEWKEETFDERWFLGDTYNLSIGQGFMLATPIQAATYVSYFANFGTAYEPHFVKEVRGSDSSIEFEPVEALTNVVSSDNLEVIRQAMRQTVTVGTSRSMQSVPVAVAGKTGTAQFNRNKTPHSWWAGFAPYEDPKVVIVSLVEEGGDVGLATTISREFLEWYFSQ